MGWMSLDFYLNNNNKMQKKLYSWQVLKVEGDKVCYNILSYNDDGSFDDYEAMVWLDKSENISDYVKKNYWKTIFDSVEWYSKE